MKPYCGILLSLTIAASVMGSPLPAAPPNPVTVSGPGTSSSVSNLTLPDPHKELRHLSKALSLKRNQRADVSFILEERAREIQLLMDIDSMSQAYRNTLAAKVMEDSNSQIETLLQSKQKRKFDKVLAKDRETR